MIRLFGLATKHISDADGRGDERAGDKMGPEHMRRRPLWNDLGGGSGILRNGRHPACCTATLGSAGELPLAKPAESRLRAKLPALHGMASPILTRSKTRPLLAVLLQAGLKPRAG
jgi:hypothetical protein